MKEESLEEFFTRMSGQVEQITAVMKDARRNNMREIERLCRLARNDNTKRLHGT